MKSKWFHVVVPICLLTAIVFICFGRTLSSYFLADDFSEVSYVAGIFQGNYGSLLADFAGNHMQTSVMKVYRPGATLALLFDYAIWRTAAWGYFLINILTMLACALMLYLLLRELTRSWGYKRSILFALLSAALFAANPLHCEPVSFISSGDYLIACLFCLLSLWCFIKNAGAIDGKFFLCGVAAFWAAVLCKEAAIGLAPALFGIAFFLPHVFDKEIAAVQVATAAAGAMYSAQTRYSLTARLRCAVMISAPLWISTIVYLALRFILLGTITGGYTAGLGSSLMSSAVQRLTNPDTIFRIVFPLNASVFGTASIYESVLAITYVALATCMLIRLITKRISWKWLGLLAVWAFSAAAPLYQVWSLGANLEGGRFFFFLTMPLSVLLPAMILAPRAAAPDVYNKTSDALDVPGAPDVHRIFSASKTEMQAVDAVAVVALCALVLIGTVITYYNNVPWVHAGRQTKACVIQGQKLAQSVPPGKRVALLGIPQNLDGAHVIYNGATFNIMMSPPFSKQNNADKFITFDPLFYGSPSYINAQRLKSVLQDPDVVGLYCWNVRRRNFEQLKKPADKELQEPAQPISLGTNCSLNLNPYQYDFIEVTLRAPCSKLPVWVYWKGEKAFEWCSYPVQGVLSVGSSGGTGTIRLRVSDQWQWYTQGNISQVKLEFLPGQPYELLNLRALPARMIMPVVSVPGLQANNLGVYQLSNSGAELNLHRLNRSSKSGAAAPALDLNFDGSAIADCAAIKIEISKPYYFFEGLAAPEDNAAVMTSITIPATKGRTHISGNVFPSSGYYQLCAVCLNAAGSPIGRPSDPTTVEF